MRLMNRFLLLLIVTVLNLPVLSYAESPESPLQSAKDALIERHVDRLTQVLKKYVKVLDRDMVVFHYQKANPNWTPTSVIDLQNHLLNMPSRFENITFNEPSMMGPGLYGAVDPLGSRGFGGRPNPQMFVMTIRKGAVLLDTRDNSSNLDSLEFKKINSEFNCKPNLDRGLPNLHNVTEYFRTSERLICREIILEAFAKLEIQGVFYSYSAVPALPNCRDRRYGAINIISASIVDSDAIAWYSDHGKVEGRNLAGFVQHLYTESRSVNQGMIDDPADLMPASVRDARVSPEDYEKWKSEKIFKCGPEWSLERAINFAGP